MNDPDWNLYRTFLGVLDAGSLSGAARALGLTQPTVGRHVDELEQALGHVLFTRSQQGLMPTELALALRPYAQSLAATAAALRRQASGALNEVDGTVRISSSDVIGVEVLPPILARLQAAHPRLGVELSLSDAVEDLLRREADIAVRMTEPKQEALVIRHVGEIELGLHAHAGYLARHGTPGSIAALSAHSIIGYDRSTAFIRAMIGEIRKRAPDFPDADQSCWSFRADSNLAQLAAIRAGVGIGFCQTRLAVRDPHLVRLFPDFRLTLPTFVAMHEDLKTTPRYRRTFDALVTGLRDYIVERQ